MALRRLRAGLVLAAALGASACAVLQGGGGSGQPDAAEEFARIEQAADSLAERMADAIRRRDAQALAWLYVAHPYAAFISDGLRIPQSRIAEVVGGSYDTMRRMDFEWERKQTLVLGRDAAAMTAWAVYTAVDTLGTATRERAVYSHIMVRQRGRWSFLTTHKSAVERLPVNQVGR